MPTNNHEYAIILIDAQGRHQIAAPVGFDWLKYPEVIGHKGKPYHYVGCIDETPHYKSGDAE